MSGWWKWIAATAVVAVVVHLASVMFLPRAIMLRTMAGMVRLAHGENRMAFPLRPTAAARGIVRPSPDLLYSSCVYDVSAGPVHVHARGMPKTYWSVSLFDADTNNFHVINDRKAHGDGVDFLIVKAGVQYVFLTVGDGPDQKHRTAEQVRQFENLPRIAAPTERGVVLFRTLIDDDKRLTEIDRARRGASCEAYRAD